MSVIESDGVVKSEDVAPADLLMPAARRRSSGWLRRVLGALLAVVTAQYIIVAVGAGLSVAGALRYGVTPKIVATFEALAVALKH
jgi:hypothetical protein